MSLFQKMILKLYWRIKMKKHILSKYAEKKDIVSLFGSQKKTKETRTIENSDLDNFASKRTVKTFSVENTDSDEIMNFSCTDAKADATETVELSDFGDYKKAMFLKEKTGITKSIETSDSDELCIANNRKKTLLTETVETSDKDEMFS